MTVAMLHGDVALAAEHAAHGVGDVVGVEAGGGDLVQQRLEQVEVVGVDDLDVDRRLGQAPWRPPIRRTRRR